VPHEWVLQEPHPPPLLAADFDLVPWPALDGGHLAFMTFEALRGRPMGERAQGEIVKWGFVGLMVLMVVIMANDVTALVTGKLEYKKSKSQDNKPDDRKTAKPDEAKSDSQPAENKSTETKYYEYRCQSCRVIFGEDRSMNEKTEPHCECGSTSVSRIWNAFIRSGGITPDVGQGARLMIARSMLIMIVNIKSWLQSCWAMFAPMATTARTPCKS